jgi:hypothetical protein
MVADLMRELGLAGDVTYVKTGEGLLNLATLLDLATGWWWAGRWPPTCARA